MHQRMSTHNKDNLCLTYLVYWRGFTERMMSSTIPDMLFWYTRTHFQCFTDFFHSYSKTPVATKIRWYHLFVYREAEFNIRVQWLGYILRSRNVPYESFFWLISLLRVLNVLICSSEVCTSRKFANIKSSFRFFKTSLGTSVFISTETKLLARHLLLPSQ